MDRAWVKGACKFMVSDSVSHIVGKRQCSRKAVKDGLCSFHQPEKVKARYAALLKRHGCSGDRQP